jgi:hypothetical protein
MKKENLYPLFVTTHVMPAAFAAASPIVLSSTTTQLYMKEKWLAKTYKMVFIIRTFKTSKH